MIWHIFKKDFKLLWKLAAGVALIDLISAAVFFKLGHFGGDQTLAVLAEVLPGLALLATAFLIAGAVHQDAIPGVRQDWLARPVKRRDLLLAKALFLAVVAYGPMLAANVLEALIDGFPLRVSLAAAFSLSVFLLLALGLPAFALASVTSNFMEAIVGGVVAFAGGAVFLAFANQAPGRGAMATAGTGAQWVTLWTMWGLGVLAAAAVVGVQYFRRKTGVARWMTASGVVLFFSAIYLQWRPAFAIQQRLSPSPGSAAAITLNFDSAAGQFRSPTGIDFDSALLRGRLNDGDALVYLPLRAAGLSPDSVLKVDRAEARVTGADGRTESLGFANDLEIRNEGPAEEPGRVHHGFRVSAALYRRISDQPARLEIEYSLTLLRLRDSYALPAIGGDERMPDVGWCKTRVNEAGTNVQFRCLAPGMIQPCATVFLEHAPDGRRNPVRSSCSPDYSPYFGRYLPNAVVGFGANLPFRDPSGLAHYPVDGAQLGQSRVVLRMYRQADHFTRRLVIPEIRLKDWEAAAVGQVGSTQRVQH